MDAEEDRTGSADSENSSDNSYVQVSKEDVQEAEMTSQEEQTRLRNSEEPEFAAEGEDNSTLTAPEITNPVKPSEDPFYIESRDPEDAESTGRVHTDSSPPIQSSGVEEVSTGPTVPKATGILSFLKVLHPSILYLIYWKDIKLSAIVFGMGLVVLLTLTLNTFIHTTVLVLHSFMVVSLTYIIIKIAIASFYNREIRNPFSDYLNRKVTLPEDKIIEWTLYVRSKLNCFFNVLVRLLLFDNYKKSFKFGLFLWLLSFVTNYFTLIRALFITITLLFTVPPIYSKHQAKIDRFLKEVCSVAVEAVRNVRRRIPYLEKTKSD